MTQPDWRITCESCYWSKELPELRAENRSTTFKLWIKKEKKRKGENIERVGCTN